MKILDYADVCIMGGALVGTNIAYRLSKEKKKVILLEEKFLTAGASGVCLPKGLSFLDGKVRPIAADGFIGTRQEFRVGHSE